MMMRGKIFLVNMTLTYTCFVSCHKFPVKFNFLKPRVQNEIMEVSQLYTCQNQNSREKYLSENQLTVESFEELINNLHNRNVKLSSADRFVLWTLAQVYYRPDQASPSAHVTAIIKKKNSVKILETQSSEDSDEISQAPLFVFLDSFLVQEKSKFSLRELITLFDRYFTLQIKVEEQLSEFLAQYKSILKEKKEKFSKYFRGTEIISTNEQLTRSNLLPSYLSTRRHNKTTLQQTDLKNIKEPTYCNFQIQNYNKGQHYIESQMIESYTFGIKNKDFIILVNTHIKGHFKKTWSEDNLLFFNTLKANPTPYCQFFKNNNSFFLISTKGKDPAQIISNLYQYEITKTTSLKQLHQILGFSRHMVLINPLRIIYESKRGNDAQLDKLNSFRIPIYHAKSIGNVQGLFQFSEREPYFILDDRSDIRVHCEI